MAARSHWATGGAREDCRASRRATSSAPVLLDGGDSLGLKGLADDPVHRPAVGVPQFVADRLVCQAAAGQLHSTRSTSRCKCMVLVSLSSLNTRQHRWKEAGGWHDHVPMMKANGSSVGTVGTIYRAAAA